MPANIPDLINKLKKEMPELANNPILDEIELAAHMGDEDEAAEGDDTEGSADDQGSSGDDGSDDMSTYAPDDEEAPPPAPAPKKKFPFMRK